MVPRDAPLVRSVPARCNLGRMPIALLAFLACLATPALPAAAQNTLKPVDEATRQPGFFSFRARLQAAIARHDVAAVLAAAHPRIRNSFGGDDGRAAFRRMWTLDRRESRLWGELAAALALGGSFDREGRFVAPYVFSRWPERLDAFQHVAIVGDRVNVRGAPRADAPRLGMLSHSIVPLAPPAARSRPGWTAVVLADGRTGYVRSEFARSPVGYRAIFAREGERWSMVTFVSGD